MEMWSWLSKNPGKNKSEMPIKTRQKLANFLGQSLSLVGTTSCTLCSIFYTEHFHCSKCILYNKKRGLNCEGENQPYNIWVKSIGDIDTLILEKGWEAAYKIYCVGRDWEIENE